MFVYALFCREKNYLQDQFLKCPLMSFFYKKLLFFKNTFEFVNFFHVSPKIKKLPFNQNGFSIYSNFFRICIKLATK